MMSETSSLRPGESDGLRNLRSPPQAGLGISTVSSHQGQSDNQTMNTTEPNVTTRLLDSYNHVDPACGERRCSHGTFSPQIQEDGRQSYIDGIGSNRHGGSVSAAGHSRGADDYSESGLESEVLSQLKTSSVLSVNDTRKQYVKSYTNPAPFPLPAYRTTSN